MQMQMNQNAAHAMYPAGEVYKTKEFNTRKG